MKGHIPDTFIDDLLVRIDIVDVINKRLTLKKAGREYTALCPFHNEKTASFTVNQEKQFYHCFGCQQNGNAIKFVMEYDHLSFVEAIDEIASQLGISVPRDGDFVAKRGYEEIYAILNEADKYFRLQLRVHPQRERAVSYLKARGLTGIIANVYGIGFAPFGRNDLKQALAHNKECLANLVAAGMVVANDDGPPYDRFRGRITFPIRNHRGQICAFGGRVLEDKQPKYLNSPETAVFSKGKELYGLYEVRKVVRRIDRLLVVEGYMDVITLAQYGINYAVAPLGTAITVDQISTLLRTTDEVVFCFDGDKAGQNAAWKALTNTLPTIREGHKLRFMLLPDGDDPDTFVRENGATAFTQKMDNSLVFSQYFFEHLKQDIDTATIDGRAILVKQARPLLAKMPEGVLKTMMIQRLAELAQIHENGLGIDVDVDVDVDVDIVVDQPGQDDAKQYLAFNPSPKKKLFNRRPFKNRISTLPAASPIRRAMGMLIQHPQLAAIWQDEEDVVEINVPGGALLSKLMQMLRCQPELTTSALLEKMQGDRDETIVQKLAAWNIETPSTGIEEEFRDILVRLKEQRKKRRVNYLLNKSQQQTLDDVEMTELRCLLVR